MGRWTVGLGAVVAASALAACSAGGSRFTEEEDSGVLPPAGDGGGGGDTAITPVPIRDAGRPSNCSEAAQLVYVLSDRNELYSFRPNLRMFTRIGTLRCPTDMAPNSMAIDRNAVAWVNYVQTDLKDSAGALYRVNTTDGSCTAAAPVALPAGWYRLGMGFSTLTADSTEEALFVTSTPGLLSDSMGLARVDTASGRLTPIGAFSGALRGQSAELTGTGDGRLFGFFTTTPAQVAQINRANGMIENTRSMHGVERPSAWAFSFWGGDFYLYTAPSALVGRTSNVTRYRPSDGSIDTAYMSNIGFRIVGAGVSTCAPIAPPP